MRSPRFIDCTPPGPQPLAAEAAAGLLARRRAPAAQVLLRRAGLAPVRRHHRTARVLPHAHRGGHLRASTAPTSPRPCTPPSAAAPRWSTWAPAIAPRRRGLFAAFGPRATWRWTSRSTSCGHAAAPAAAAPGASRWWAWAWTSRPGWPCPPDLVARPGAGVLPGLQHRQLRARRALRLLREAHAAAAGRRAADRRRPASSRRTCWRPPTTTRWASPPPSTSTCCAT